MDRDEVARGPRPVEPQFIDQETENFFSDIERSGALPKEVSASDAATAVLCTLVMQLSGQAQTHEVLELVATVPPMLQMLIGWCVRHCVRHHEKRPATFNRQTFLYDIADHLGIETDVAFRVARAVFTAVRARLSTQEIEKVAPLLPYDLGEFWRP